MATKKTAAKSPAKAEPKTAANKSTPAKSEAKKAPAKSTSAKTAEPKTRKAPAHHEIADLAHKYYTERGRGHHGKHVDDWLRAEKDLSR